MKSPGMGQVTLLAALVMILILTIVWATSVWKCGRRCSDGQARLDRARLRNVLFATDWLRADGTDVLQ